MTMLNHCARSRPARGHALSPGVVALKKRYAPVGRAVDLTDLYTYLTERFDRIDLRTELVMTELENLQAAVAAEDAAIEALKTEQAVFLADVAARLEASGIDPALLAPITADITARVADLQALTVAEVAADPGTAEPAVDPSV